MCCWNLHCPPTEHCGYQAVTSDPSHRNFLWWCVQRPLLNLQVAHVTTSSSPPDVVRLQCATCLENKTYEARQMFRLFLISVSNLNHIYFKKNTKHLHQREIQFLVFVWSSVHHQQPGPAAGQRSGFSVLMSPAGQSSGFSVPLQ